MKNTEQLTFSTFYHVYNKGVNRMSIFRNPGNYVYFLERYANYINPIADTYAYCLLGNHFHFLIKIKEEREIMEFISKKGRESNPDRNLSKNLSLQFSHFFNGYTQAFNKQQGRSGKLFELPFRRISVTEEAYFSPLVYYIHANPQHMV